MPKSPTTAHRQAPTNGGPETAYQIVSDASLNFAPGTVISDLTQEVGDAGTIGGPNNNVVTTDATGKASVKLIMPNEARNFIRLELAP